jgi:hypothetical protein
VRSLLLIFFGAVAITLLLWVIIPERYFDPASWDYDNAYRPISDTILEGHAFIWNGPDQSIRVPKNAPILRVRTGFALVRFPPGYTLMIAATRYITERLRVPEKYGIDTLNVVAVGISAVCLFAVASSVFGASFALAAPGLLVTYPGLLLITRQPASEIPFCALVFGALTVVWPAIYSGGYRTARCFAAGVLLGGAMLVRAEGIGLSVVIAIMLVLLAHRTPLKFRLFRAGMIILGSLIAVLPWETWAYRQTAHVIPLATSGPASVCDGLTFALDRSTGREKVRLSADLNDLSLNFLVKCDKASSNTETIAFLYTELGLHPSRVLKLMLLKVSRSWYATDSGRLDRDILIIQLGYCLLFVWATAVSIESKDPGRALASMVWVLVVYFWAMTVAVLSILRYMVPAMGLLFVLGPAAIKSLVRGSDSQ